MALPFNINHHNNNDMENKGGLVWGAICGLGGGMFKYFHMELMQIDILFWAKLWQAGLTALVCGVLGAAGKWAFEAVKERIRKRKKNY